ncbi:DNA alkylation repair protein [Amycolatopsis cihanbeyliensis]|uniref:3-methyladenine DNA glycosylase AlkD n=1 Tax=Amycolatopsis cihanbeyliensis TaxID=1128664 RepID=A0A542DEI1_AMYCI|nr:DNA alkylation repair protein [Amycolatopsis cihanbeyliensis]TQJ01479.1 3-methyladenine DNA glycosylase AlkD [Amycolatopsis cihanbeyliensis]
MSLIEAVRTGLADLADPAKAPAMRAYMKSELPFRGVAKPARQRLGRQVFAEHPLPDVETWTATVLELWRGARYREERYLALDLTGHRSYSAWQGPELLPLYEELIVTGAWWDFVDEIAAHRVGPILRASPEAVDPVLRDWANGVDRWKRRGAVICQLGSKKDTRTRLLEYCVEANIDDPDFFLRKGIGWALRQYARVDPDWVRAFVRTHPGLSPLSRREALRHLEGNDGAHP